MAMPWSLAIYVMGMVWVVLNGWVSTCLMIADEIARGLRSGEIGTLPVGWLASRLSLVPASLSFLCVCSYCASMRFLLFELGTFAFYYLVLSIVPSTYQYYQKRSIVTWCLRQKVKSIEWNDCLSLSDFCPQENTVLACAATFRSCLYNVLVNCGGNETLSVIVHD